MIPNLQQLNGQRATGAKCQLPPTSGHNKIASCYQLVIIAKLASTMQMSLRVRQQCGPAARQPRARRSLCVAVRASTTPEWTGRQFTMLSTGEDATRHLAQTLVGAGISQGDAFCLKGDEKAGKSVFV